MHVLVFRHKRVPHVALTSSFVLANSFGEEKFIVETLTKRDRPCLKSG